MRLKTDLSNNFELLHFESEYSYLTIDWKKNMYSSLGIKLTREDVDIIEDILLALSWLDLRKKIDAMRRENRKIAKK